MLVRVVLLALLALTPGCCTYSVWSWASDRQQDVVAPTAIESVVRRPDGGFDIRVRRSDGSAWEGVWAHDAPASPGAAFEEARLLAPTAPEAALRALERAVGRGLQRRDLASAAPALAAHPLLLRLESTPPALPSLALRRGTWPDRGLFGLEDRADEAPAWIVVDAPPARQEAILDVPLLHVDAVHPGPWAVAVLGTPLMLTLDVATSPFQLVIGGLALMIMKTPSH